MGITTILFEIVGSVILKYGNTHNTVPNQGVGTDVSIIGVNAIL
jgi:hypothetical protein